MCNLASKYGQFNLVFIAKINKDGAFKIIASNDENIEGKTIKVAANQNLIESAKRDSRNSNERNFNELSLNIVSQSFTDETENKLEDYSRYSFPIYSKNHLWAILFVYCDKKRVLYKDCKILTNETANCISIGVSKIRSQKRQKRINFLQKAILDNAMIGIAMIKDRKIVQINKHCLEMFGYNRPMDLIGKSTRMVLSDEDEYKRIGSFYPELSKKGNISINNVRYKNKNSEILTCDVSVGLVRDNDENISIWAIKDVSERNVLQKQLSQSLEYQRTIFENSSAGIFVVDSRRVIAEVNPAMCKIFGYDREELIGQSALILHESKISYYQFYPIFETSKKDKSKTRIEYKFKKKDGSIIWTEILGAPLTLPNGEKGVIWNLIDVTELHDTKQKIVYQAFHDALTGLPNRRALENHIPLSIERSKKNGSYIAVGIIDLDNFKPVNDKWGHEAGDRLLKDFSHRLQNLMRNSELVIRLGGDEFIIVIEDLDYLKYYQQLEIILKRIHKAIEAPFEVAKGIYANVGMSIGVSIYPKDAQDTDSLIRKADAALYHMKLHKLDRENWYHFFTKSLYEPEIEEEFDAYGEKATILLKNASNDFDSVISQFIEAFFKKVSHDPEQKKIAVNLSIAEVDKLKQSQFAHLRFIFNPKTTKDEIVKRAQNAGRSHALVGVTSSMLLQTTDLFRRLLSDHLNSTLMSPRDRYWILLIADIRLHQDIKTELEFENSYKEEYLKILSSSLPPHSISWPDARERELTPLGRLPGIQSVLLIRLDKKRIFTLESSSGNNIVGTTIDFESLLNKENPAKNNISLRKILSKMWLGKKIISLACLSNDLNDIYINEIALKNNIRSILSIPILDESNQTTAIIVLNGAFPNQFESSFMGQFARSLKYRWEQIISIYKKTEIVMPQSIATYYKQQLFSGGLKIFFQPILDLKLKKFVKVEALARLQISNNEIIPPGVFLPLLSNKDLDLLFHLGLEEVLYQISIWDSIGFFIDSSINLAPCSLLDISLPKYIKNTLDRYSISLERLTLELLESQNIEKDIQDRSINEISNIGVQIAMDDLGSGYSSLQRLSNLPFDLVKVDQGLLSKIRQNPLQTLCFVESIIQMGDDFERKVVVEGLEKIDMVEAAAILGAQYGQGYALAKPMPANQVVQWIQNFKFPIEEGKIHSYLGALAYHLQYMRRKNFLHDNSIQDCPLTDFLIKSNLEKTDAFRFHELIHSGKDLKSNSKKLLEWLNKKVIEEDLEIKNEK
ncbi:EAL domain-containing protein [Thermodesulfobium sp. 4217-1]|uniref:EAL domain-containing protein n=1 Tax=Thermodesulfobium sp. 4217-1 TaxID=3120013 RepID=UPI003221A5E2